MTAKEVLNNCNSANGFYTFVKSLHPQPGTLGGRRFYNEKKEGGSVCLNDVVRRLNELYTKNTVKDKDTFTTFQSILVEINQKDQEANTQINGVILKILTAIKSWIGSICFNRTRTLQSISQHIDQELMNLQLNLFNSYFEITDDNSIILKPGLDSRNQQKAKGILERAIANYGSNSKNYVHHLNAPKTFERSTGTFTEDINSYIGGRLSGNSISSIYPVGYEKDPKNPEAVDLIHRVRKYIDSQLS